MSFRRLKKQPIDRVPYQHMLCMLSSHATICAKIIMEGVFMDPHRGCQPDVKSAEEAGKPGEDDFAISDHVSKRTRNWLVSVAGLAVLSGKTPENYRNHLDEVSL